jgi:hypothetical protein
MSNRIAKRKHAANKKVKKLDISKKIKTNNLAGTRLMLAFSPTTPQTALGMRIDPTPSSQIATGTYKNKGKIKKTKNQNVTKTTYQACSYSGTRA